MPCRQHQPTSSGDPAAPGDPMTKSVISGHRTGVNCNAQSTNNAAPPIDRTPTVSSSANAGISMATQNQHLEVSGKLSRSGSAQACLPIYRHGSGKRTLRQKTFDKRRTSGELFDAVVNKDISLVTEIIGTHTVDINCMNQDSMTVLDLAVMSNNIEMVKLLMTNGAIENPHFLKSVEIRNMKLLSLAMESEQMINKYSDMSPAPVDAEKQLKYWQLKYQLIKHMKSGFEQAQTPDPPTNVTLGVADSTTLMVRFSEPQQHNGAIVTRYRVQWSKYSDFSNITGQQILEGLQWPYYEIAHLTSGQAYHVRVSAWNMKGYSAFACSTPRYAVPSSWREVSGTPASRLLGNTERLDELLAEARRYRTGSMSSLTTTNTTNTNTTANNADSSLVNVEQNSQSGKQATSPLRNRKSNVRKSIKHLFSMAPKFQKTLKRGVYLSCLVFHDDKLLLTSDENLPTIEVDDNFNAANLQADFNWLMKVACTWDDVKSLRQDMSKNLNSSVILFRSKLLHAVSQLQSALGTKNLGQFHHTSTRDLNGSVILTTVLSVALPSSVSTTHTRWVSIERISRKFALTDNSTAQERLLLSVPEMIRHSNTSADCLPRGLYLCYLKLKSSVDSIQIMVPRKRPNVLPYVQIRGSPCVTREEWAWFKQQSRDGSRPISEGPSTGFAGDLLSACNRMFNMLDITDEESSLHRLYDAEVIEFNSEVSCLLLLPPAGNVCSGPGNHDRITETPYSKMLPLQMFEMIHLRAYRPEFIARYSRLSSVLEMDASLTTQQLREAFSTEETKIAKLAVEQVTSQQTRLEETWKTSRWTLEVINSARDKSSPVGLPFSAFGVSPEPDCACMKLPETTSVSPCDNGYHSDRSSSMGHAWNKQHPPPQLHQQQLSHNCSTAGLNLATSSHQTADATIDVRVDYPNKTTLNIRAVRVRVMSSTSSRDIVRRVTSRVNSAHTTTVDDVVDLDQYCLVYVNGRSRKLLPYDCSPVTLSQALLGSGELVVRRRDDELVMSIAGEHTQVTSV